MLKDLVWAEKLQSGGFMKHLLSVLFAVVFFTSCYAEDNLVFYSAGKKDPAAWSTLKEYFSSKNYALSFYQGDGVIERHLEKVNRINTIKSGLFVGIEFTFGEEKRVMVAMAGSGKDGQANSGTESEGHRRFLWGVDELPAKHEAESKRLAESVAGQFQVAVKRIPLFPLLGVDMPGIFVSIHCHKEEAGSLLTMLDAALRKYYKRDRP
jgi:hypothetical protein